jgi:hypothetical protein
MRPVMKVFTSGTDESNGIRTSLGEPFWCLATALLCSSPHRKDERDGPAPTPRVSFFPNIAVDAVDVACAESSKSSWLARPELDGAWASGMAFPAG